MTKNNNPAPCALFISNRAFMLARSCLPFMRHLLKSGWRVIAVTYPDRYAEELVGEGVTVETLLPGKKGLHVFHDLKIFRQIVRACRKYRPDLIHSFSGKPIILGNIAALFGGKPIIINTLTGLGHPFIAGGVPYFLASSGFRVALRRSALVTFLNADDLNLFVDRGLVKKDRARRFYGEGVNSQIWSPAEKSDRPREKTVLMVGRLLWQKGIREFVEAAVICRKEFPNARFQIAGEPDLEHPDHVPLEWIERQVANGTIEYLGYLRNLPEILPSKDVFCLPSYREGQPRAILEAAACGVPVVATDVPGCREMVVDGENGFLAPSKDSVGLAKSLCRLLGDEELCSRFGAAGRRLVVKDFDIENLAREQLEIYRELGLPVSIPQWPKTQ
jgi:glycosyltransferase involved in cell wall biosynthesis